jgi:osmotically-inducible protein OsmY
LFKNGTRLLQANTWTFEKYKSEVSMGLSQVFLSHLLSENLLLRLINTQKTTKQRMPPKAVELVDLKSGVVLANVSVPFDELSAFVKTRANAFLLVSTLGQSATLSVTERVTPAPSPALESAGPADVAVAPKPNVVLVDRISSDARSNDDRIERIVVGRLREIASLAHINVSSYNRAVLLTGEVPDESTKAKAYATAASVPNVKFVVNELTVEANSSAVSRATDSVLASKVKDVLSSVKDVDARVYRIVSERGVVYLRGRVVEREADRATDLTRSIAGVQKVVRVFEIVSENELSNPLR